MIEIKRWDTGGVIHSGDFADLKECLEDGVKKGVSFFYAKLNYAELNHAKLNHAKLNYAELNHAKLNHAKLT
ncbi:coil containing protein [Vibrio phage 1.184.A._10N.286.49.A5]|nr:coil containing protein [Vibrio phage 1.184.A._10N.286.49.A5]